MKIRLHKPGRGLWTVALLLFVVGLVSFVVPIPFVSQFAFYLMALAAALLLLGTWII